MPGRDERLAGAHVYGTVYGTGGAVCLPQQLAMMVVE